jgi:hypothetical protein
VTGLAGQYATVDELLTGRENLELIGLERLDLAGAARDLVRQGFVLLNASDLPGAVLQRFGRLPCRP